MFNPELPYNDLPCLRPKADIDTKAILKACIAAKASLAGLKAKAKRIPNQEMAINILPMLGTQAS